MDFFEGAEEIGDVDVDEGIVDEGLSLIRKLWDVHRSDLGAHLRKTEGLALCGRGAPCPP